MKVIYRKILKFITVLLVIAAILLGFICWLMFRQNNKLNGEIYGIETEIEQMNSEKDSIVSLLNKKANGLPFIIVDIQYTDVYDAEDYFYEKKTYAPCSSLYFRAYFITLEKDVKDLWLTFRLTDAEGISLYDGKNGEIDMKFDEIYNYWKKLPSESFCKELHPGKYRYEVRYKDKLIASKDVIIYKDKTLKESPKSSSVNSNNDDVWF